MTDTHIKSSEAAITLEVSGLEFRWDLVHGRFTIGGVPSVALFRDSSLAYLMQGFLAMVGPQRFALAQQAEGMRSIEGDWTIISAAPTFEVGFMELAKYAKTAGWGRWEIVEIDRVNHVAIIRSHGSWEGESQRAIGVSHGSGFCAGKFMGLCQRLFEVSCWPRQTMFVADGDPYDEFVIEPSDRSIDAELEALASSGQATASDLQRLLAEVSASSAAREVALAERDRMVVELQDKVGLIAEQQQAIVALSTPIIQLWDGVLAVPVVGAINADRTAQMMERLLEAIIRERAQFAILDVTGVETIDTSTADNFVRIVRAVQLLGAQGVIAGIGPLVAQTIVDLGVDLTGIPTYSNLREALQAHILATRRAAAKQPAIHKEPSR